MSFGQGQLDINKSYIGIIWYLSACCDLFVKEAHSFGTWSVSSKCLKRNSNGPQFSKYLNRRQLFNMIHRHRKSTGCSIHEGVGCDVTSSK
ncbi:hypothetical protein NQ317_008824 [Molorchus minor]|uniref:Uncharacterized protein n=1 Tax=Molorchus minor TaxID=1323400 RepID=A0ABQ9JV27_9CUCU|nr:hypothetical protein NQ317_008824 [Molorchus minor]